MTAVWVRRNFWTKLLFCKKRRRFVIVVSILIIVSFFFYQFTFISLLNESQLETSTPSRESLLRLEPILPDANAFDSGIFLRGVRSADLVKYKPKEDGTFACFSTGAKIPYAFVNDDYCDCPDDGSDEPGTNACNNGRFYCRNQKRHPTGRGGPRVIPSGRVNDGICDCCDGSDEWKGVVLDDLPLTYHQSKVKIRRAPCTNVCMYSKN